MKKTKLTVLSLVTGTMFLVNTGCDNTPKDSKERAEDINETTVENAENMNMNKTEKDAQFVVDAYSANMFEIRASEAAQTKATTTQAKEMADMLVTAHTKANNELGALAQTKQIAIPDNLTTGQQEDINDMNEKTGIDFDKKYASVMVDKHEAVVKMFEDAAKDCDDADIKMWANNMLPDLRQHLQMAKNQKDVLDKM